MWDRHVVVVENEDLLRDLLAKSLELAGFKVTTAANAADAKRVCLAADPDAMVVDIELGPGPNGFDLVDAVTRESPDIAVVFLTNLPDPRFAGRDKKGVPAGAGYLRKSQLAGSSQLVEALEAVLKDSVEPKHLQHLDENRPLASLSRRQLSVLQMVAAGMTNAQIAEERQTTVRAVEGILGRVFQSLGIDTNLDGNARIEAARAYLLATK